MTPPRTSARRTALLCLLTAASFAVSAARADDPIVLSGPANSRIDLPDITVTGPDSQKSVVMLLHVPKWMEVENGERIGAGMWMFPLARQKNVKLKLKADATGNVKINAMIYVDSTGDQTEREYFIKVADKSKPQPAGNRGGNTRPGNPDNNSTIEFPLSPTSPEVLQSDHIMLINVPETLSVQNGLRIGNGMWLIKRDAVADARIEVTPGATGLAGFRAFAVGAGGAVSARLDVKVDLADRKLISPNPNNRQTPANDAGASPSPNEQTAQLEPKTEPKAGATQKPGVVDWRSFLDKQKDGDGTQPSAANKTPAADAAASGPTRSDDELIVMGRFLVKECTTCHNVYAKDVGIPVMAGLTADRFINTMDLYRRGKRSNKVMQSIANSLSDDETRALALYLARIKPGEATGGAEVDGAAIATRPAQDSEEAQLELAKVLVRECTTCHSLYGNDVGIPVMIGLEVDRFKNTIDLYRRKKRSNKIMQSVAASLSESDTHALALYLSRIKPATAEQIAAPSPQAPKPKPAKRTLRKADREQTARIAGWIERAQSMIDNGNVSSARLLLKRAAEFGDARAALLIASSYDPNVLKWDPMTGIVAEPLMARKWYLEAKALGAGPEVDRRLAALPPANR